MNAETFCEQFATFAEAPNGVAKLRELILQLAVQGKLGTQDVNDEPASVLVEQIVEYRKQSTGPPRDRPRLSPDTTAGCPAAACLPAAIPQRRRAAGPCRQSRAPPWTGRSQTVQRAVRP